MLGGWPTDGLPALNVKYTLSFEDFLDARNEKETVPSKSTESFPLMRTVIFTLGGVAPLIWNPTSAVILSTGLLIILAAMIGNHFYRRNAIKNRNNELEKDFEQFSSGNYRFEADEKGWRLYSTRDELVHDWEELFMIKKSTRILYLVTYSGACTLPKAAFTSEQLS